MTSTAVVILNYNGSAYLKRLLPSVINHSGDATIVVADNASTDDSVRMVKERFPTVSTIAFEKNYGYAGGYNEALKKVTATYYILLNSDVEVTKNWLPPLINFLDENEHYAACQPKIKDHAHREKFEYAGACGGFIDALGYPYCRGRIFDTLETDMGQYDHPTDTDWASGACMVIRAKIFHQLGGFDSDFFAHMEEVDLCWRIRSKGFAIRILPQSTVFHIGGGTLHKQSTFKTFLNFRNGLFLLIKNLPTRFVIYKLPLRILLDWTAALKFIIDGKRHHAWAIGRAHLSCLTRFRHFWAKRTHVSNDHRIGSIVWKYFVSGKKTFNEL